tara:strand:+ start:11 stop:496 length:486 start_codon:yes stop_codon:yes gene_type:complete
MKIIKQRNISIVILCFSIFSLLFAYYVELILGHQPCNLCILERVPYVAAIIIIITSFILQKFEKSAFFVLGVIFLLAAILSTYHFGIEQGFFEESPVCKNRSNLDIFDKEKLLIELQKNSVSCKNVTFSIFGFSLATINTFVSFLISFITMRAFYNYEKKQ